MSRAIFFLPSFVLGMVSPVVIKLALANLERSGHTVGTIYACSTIGSIVGTFLTGFYLISWLGTRTIVWLVAGTLLADRRRHRCLRPTKTTRATVGAIIVCRP